MGIQVAIDGPAGAGKSTVAKKAAQAVSFIYVDTGAMYRAMAVHLLRKGITADKADRIPEGCQDADISIRYENGEQVVLLHGENVNSLIRTEEVSQMASVCSALPEVRAKLLNLQRKLAEENDVIMDGRDIGTVILPEAQVKIFLTAGVDARAERRYKEQKAKGIDCSYEEIRKEIEERDYRDMHRETSPLKQAEDAVLLDTSFMGPEEAAGAVVDLIRRKVPAE